MCCTSPISRGWFTAKDAESAEKRKECGARPRFPADGRIRRWGKIPEMGGRFLRVVLLPDGETVPNAFFDRGYKP